MRVADRERERMEDEGIGKGARQDRGKEVSTHTDGAEELVLDVLKAEDGLEGGARGGVDHLLADVGKVGRPDDEDEVKAKGVLGVETVEEVAGMLVLHVRQHGVVVMCRRELRNWSGLGREGEREGERERDGEVEEEGEETGEIGERERREKGRGKEKKRSIKKESLGTRHAE